MTYRLNEYLICEVPEGAVNFRLEKVGPTLFYSLPNGRDTNWIDLPEGQWHLVCKGTEVDEVMAGEMVELITVQCQHVPSKKYKNYGKGSRFNYALESFQSYLAANNLTAASIAVLKLK